MSWELLAAVAVAILGALGLVWIFAGRWVSASKGGAVAKDDLKEADGIIEAKEHAEEVGRETPKTGRSLRRWLRGY